MTAPEQGNPGTMHCSQFTAGFAGGFRHSSLVDRRRAGSFHSFINFLTDHAKPANLTPKQPPRGDETLPF
jgi:hypothetical protein